MAILPWRLFGLSLLVLAITVPSCRALFPRDGTGAPQPFTPGFVRE